MKFRNVMAGLFVAIFMVTGTAWAGDKIDVNTATAEQLQSVKGIGEKTAAAIVAYREAHGAFKGLDDLVDVKGIGKKKLAKIEDELEADDAHEHHGRHEDEGEDEHEHKHKHHKDKHDD